jgi:hypothetical protein
MRSGTMSQGNLLVIYEQIKVEAESCDRTDMLGHYNHILFALQQLIESGEATELDPERVVQFRPPDPTNRLTFVIDL